ncbi:hypothetical protein DFA_00574 [Cavenderia fasciculata]|uniref:EGF-like domain-containing protein n=1 Tax=Cavenderia fasciculata TaxID=261658 RepID=F4PSM1_CACFS|nr:uncharacterized protein DFA_00574 [Cavenderia fasciculata]EGG20713.1 hypothetical protein DFA_00574 [Cavenderia fasciculata]|eukprot:XP_004358563.1 hypothetical protein DFA_00574 [Cavenderia fasciculata]
MSRRYTHQLFGLVTITILIFFCSSISTVGSQPLPANELLSANWLIKQYCLSILQDETSICAATPIFTCELVGGTAPTDYHITRISIPLGTNTANQPGPLASLDLSELTSFIINGPASISDPTQNILTKINNLPKLNYLEITADQSAISMPISFGSTLPALKIFHSSGCPYRSIDGLFFNNSALNTISIDYVNSVNFDSSLYLPDLVSLTIVTDLLAPGKIFTFESSSFPKLYTITLKNSGYMLTLALKSITTSNLVLINTHLNFDFGGYDSTVSPTFDQFISLKYLYMRNVSTIVIPFASYPPLLTSIIFNDDHFTSFPSIPLGSNLKQMTLQNSNLNGQVPWGIFANKSNFELNLQESEGIVGSVSESFCSNKLFIQNSGISSVPDCFWCYVFNPSIFQTSLTISPTFSCNITFETMDLVTNNGITQLNGNNIGFGNSGPSYMLTSIIGNKKLDLMISPFIYGIKTPITIETDSYHSSYSFVFTYLETVFTYSYHEMNQVSNGVYQFNFYFIQTLENTLVDLTYRVTYNQSKECKIDSIAGNSIRCNITDRLYPLSQVWFDFSNGYENNPFLYVPISIYPVILSHEIGDFITAGSILSFYGKFAIEIPKLVVIIDGNSTVCNVSVTNSGQIECTILQNIKGGPQSNITILTDNGFTSEPLFVTLNTPYQQCQQIYSNCSGHGICNLDNGQCDCNPGYFSTDCSLLSYPIISSGSVDLNDTRLISLFGDFGPNNQTDLSLLANNTLNCLVTFKSQQSINCTLPSIPSVGLLSFTVHLDSITVLVKDLIYIYPTRNNNNTGGNSTKEQCEKDTFNCHGHGICDDNGVCQCYPDYQMDDNCLTKIINNTNQPNTTAPTPSFNIDGLSFQFEMIAIQEIDIDNQISMDYQSALSTLRVLFKPTINNNQSVEYDCQEEEIQSLTFDQISDSIQYLRVIKDNIQFTGRFVDYVLSNGRDALSKTYLINQTNDIDNSKQSNIIIGIGMPQCQSCILDPDFTPLLIDKSNDGGCDKKSNTWKIIVGVVIGGVALIAISVASIMHFKKKKLFNRQQKAFNQKLKALNH